ncbi:MAG: hypothetical protein EAZ91_17175 [Cytophagales bacterium]|nr:MAG: hypothetical protein EAZ91_17175 [Cytophagales bacterium]
MESAKLLTTAYQTTTTATPSTARRKANGAATASLLIQIASEMLATSPTLRKKLGVTLTDLAAAEKVGKALTRKGSAN